MCGGLNRSMQHPSCSGLCRREVGMLRLSPEEKAEIRRLAATGMPSRQIGRVMGRADRTVGDYIDRMKQLPPRVRTRASVQLTLAEREQISRGLAEGRSVRVIAARIGRSPSTVCREVVRNGGRQRYRAAAAEDRAWVQGCRPKIDKQCAHRLRWHRRARRRISSCYRNRTGRALGRPAEPHDRRQTHLPTGVGQVRQHLVTRPRGADTYGDIFCRKRRVRGWGHGPPRGRRLAVSGTSTSRREVHTAGELNICPPPTCA